MTRLTLLLPLCLSLHVLAQKGLERSPLERRMERMGLQEVTQADSLIQVSLMYARADNFTGRTLYSSLHHAWLHPQALKALVRARRILQRLRPDLTLKVYDAARPMSVQREMYQVVRGTSKAPYVSNPARGGGLHNYGLAVDLTLATLQGDTLPMGTRIDHMGRRAHGSEDAALLKEGKITLQAYRNRRLLRRVMREAGWRALPSEWWHFNLVSRQEARARFKVIP